ncbi:hypothetical protein [Candidatus Enterococcus huntleyi]|uniref:hypothetical protein n=1 Tax=Candidatus Enterococcus huntleyi TaxID=1857217 RepID=UPI001F299A67|nr:hypothetical protein [Enterococcus sp. JM4C]
MKKKRPAPRHKPEFIKIVLQIFDEVGLMSEGAAFFSPFIKRKLKNAQLASSTYQVSQ